MERAKILILIKVYQPLRVIQSNHLRFLNRLRLARTNTAVYHINKACHHYTINLPTYNRANINIRNLWFIYVSESIAGCTFVINNEKALPRCHNYRSHSLDGAAHKLLKVLIHAQRRALFYWEYLFEYCYLDTSKLFLKKIETELEAIIVQTIEKVFYND